MDLFFSFLGYLFWLFVLIGLKNIVTPILNKINDDDWHLYVPLYIIRGILILLITLMVIIGVSVMLMVLFKWFLGLLLSWSKKPHTTLKFLTKSFDFRVFILKKSLILIILK